MTYDLDALFRATNAPGFSAFNRVDTSMAPLSKEMAGLILDHKPCGAHLNSKGETSEKNLDLRKFQYAGSTLADTWSTSVINGNPTAAENVHIQRT